MAHQQQLPAFTIPEQPTLAPILALHRGHDGYVSFHRKNPETGNHEDLFSIKATDLDGYFPQLLPIFEKDSYFSVNGFYRDGYGYARNAPDGLKLGRAHRQVKDLRWLTCTYTDIDCHNLGIDAGQAIGSIISAQDAGLVPPASMLTRSGRGVWAFWFLHDAKNESTPARAWDEKIRTWCAAQNEISNRFAAVGADAQAKDAARITRIVGSLNTKSSTRVGYWIQASETGKPFVYSLNDLAAFFDIEIKARHPKIQQKVDMLSERGRKGQRGRWLKARKNFERLWELRGGFRPGTRHAAVFVYAAILRSQRLDEGAVWSELWRLYAALHQDDHPFLANDLKATGSGVGPLGPKFGGLRNQTIADMLNVTPDEAAVLDGWPAASRYVDPTKREVETLDRNEKAQRRQWLVKSRVEQLGYVPSLSELAEWLTGRGLDCVAATVANDLKALKIENPRSQQSRKRKRAQKKQRKLL